MVFCIWPTMARTAWAEWNNRSVRTQMYLCSKKKKKKKKLAGQEHCLCVKCSHICVVYTYHCARVLCTPVHCFAPIFVSILISDLSHEQRFVSAKCIQGEKVLSLWQPWATQSSAASVWCTQAAQSRPLLQICQ